MYHHRLNLTTLPRQPETAPTPEPSRVPENSVEVLPTRQPETAPTPEPAQEQEKTGPTAEPARDKTPEPPQLAGKPNDIPIGTQPGAQAPSNSEQSSESSKQDPKGPYTFESVSAGEYHTCGVLTDASIICWGGTSLDKPVHRPDSSGPLVLGQATPAE